jgi:hypothetical protein
MPRKRTQKIYFGEEQEQAVVRYLESESESEKNKIFNEYLREPLTIMVESIIRRYKLYRKDMDFEEIHMDTHSFLMTKIDKFKPAKEKKAYSYFGTICKNYLMGQILKDQKEMNRKISYEDISSDLQHSPDMIYHIDDDTLTTEDIIKKFLEKLTESINDKHITEPEVKLGKALYDMFDNYNNIFLDTSNNKFNKNVILFELREMTNLSTKEIRIYLKKFKILYLETLKRIHNE